MCLNKIKTYLARLKETLCQWCRGEKVKFVPVYIPGDSSQDEKPKNAYNIHLWIPHAVGETKEGWLDRIYLHHRRKYSCVITTREQETYFTDNERLENTLLGIFTQAGGRPCWVKACYIGDKGGEIDRYEVTWRCRERLIFWKNKKQKKGENEMEELKLARFYNANGFSMGIVAVIEWSDKEKKSGQWAAYIGATKETTNEEDTAVFVAERGRKLSKEDAQHYFPNIQLPYKE